MTEAKLLSTPEKKVLHDLIENARGCLLFVIDADKNFDWHQCNIKNIDANWMIEYYKHETFYNLMTEEE